MIVNIHVMYCISNSSLLMTTTHDRHMTISIYYLHTTMNYYLYHRGSTFRPEYTKTSRLRGILCNTPVALVTATATQAMKTDILDAMGVDTDECLHVSEIPNR